MSTRALDRGDCNSFKFSTSGARWQAPLSNERLRGRTEIVTSMGDDQNRVQIDFIPECPQRFGDAARVADESQNRSTSYFHHSKSDVNPPKACAPRSSNCAKALVVADSLRTRIAGRGTTSLK